MYRVSVGLVLANCALAIACGGRVPPPQAAHPAPEPQQARAADVATPPQHEGLHRLSRDVVPTSYEIAWSIDPRAQGFSGLETIHVRATHALTSFEIHAQALTLSNIQARDSHGRETAGQFEVLDAADGLGRIRFERPVGPGDLHVQITWSGTYDNGLAGLYRAGTGDDLGAYTQFEAISARKAFPCFDEPGFKVPFETTISAPADLVALSNTRELEAEALAGSRIRHRFARTQALPTYLVALAVGPFSMREGVFAPNEVRSTPLPFRLISLRGTESETEYAFNNAERLVTALERWFGVAYPYDKLDFLAVPDFGAGAMENAGLITYRDSFLRLGNNPAANMREWYAHIVAHECAHQWFGNLVTMEFWDDLWLNEAFATWMQSQSVREAFPEFDADAHALTDVPRAMSADTLADARILREPIHSRGDINNAFDRITYEKGSRVIEMLRAWLSPEVFQRGIRTYLEEHRFRNATTADLMRTLGAVSGQDVSAVFDSFSLQNGVPLVRIEAVEGNATGATYRLMQSEYTPLGMPVRAPRTWRIPICLEAPSTTGSETVRACTVLTDATPATITLNGARSDALHANPQGSGYYVYQSALATPRSGNLLDRLAEAQNTTALLRAGAISWTRALSIFESVGRDDHRLLSGVPQATLGWLKLHVLTAAEQPFFARYIRSIYQARWQHLGFDARASDSVHDRAQRQQAFSALAFLAIDGPTRRDARQRAQRILAPQPNYEAVAPDLLGDVLRVEAEMGGSASATRMREVLANNPPPHARRALIGALGYAATGTNDVLDFALSQSVRTNEVASAFFIHSTDPRNTHAALDYALNHYDAILARVGEEEVVWFFALPQHLCATADIAAYRPRFESFVARLSGADRILGQALGEAERCAARKEHDANDVRQYFSARASTGR